MNNLLIVDILFCRLIKIKPFSFQQETKMKFDFNTKALDGIWVAVKKRH